LPGEANQILIGIVLLNVRRRFQIAWRKLARASVLGAAGLVGVALIGTHTVVGAQATQFLHYLEASKDAQGVSGKITLWERVLYSFILSAS